MALARYWAGLALDARWLWLLAPCALASFRRQTIATLLLVGWLCFGIGAVRGTSYFHQMSGYTALSKQKVTVVGRATDDGVYGQRYQLTFGLDHVEVAAPYRVSLPGSITVAGFGASSVNRDDIVQVSGQLYPTRGNAQASISFGDLTVLASNPSLIDNLRRRFNAGVESALPEPEASFGLGLLIGQRNTLPQAVAQQLLMVGLTHIIAVSGYNLTIIVMATRRIFGKLSKFQYTAVAIGLIGLFLLITGSSPSIVRASVISVLGIAAWYYGRTIKPLVLLLVSAAITVLGRPLYLWGNVSWYLSFLAFFGVLVLSPLVRRRLFGPKRELGLVGSVLLESLCAEAMTLPYVLYIFGQMSTVSLLANLLVAAFIPLAMLLTLIAGLAGMLAPAVAGWLAWPAKLLLTYMLDIANLLSRVPHAFIENLTFSLPAMLVCYGIVGFLCLMLWGKRKEHGIITEKKRLQTEGA